MKCNCFFLNERVSNLGKQLSYDSGETGIYLFHQKNTEIITFMKITEGSFRRTF